MSVLVDSPVWSLALRRKKRDLNSAERGVIGALAELIRRGRATLIGPVRQEVLSGVRGERSFRRLRQDLEGFEDLAIEAGDYVQAARFFNLCQRHGVTGASTDLLICAVAHRRGLPIFTVDRDFARYAKHLPIQLYSPIENAA